MGSFNAEENVSVTLHITPEAAAILRQHGGERNRGRFLSTVLVEWQHRLQLESQVVSVEASRRPQVASKPSNGSGKRKKRR